MVNWLYTSTPLHYFVQSLWRDEAFTYLLAKKNLLEVILLSAKDFSPPLYFMLMNLWVRMFGPSEVALRSVSLLAFAGAVYAFFLFLTNVFKIKAKWAYVYLLLFIVNPFLNYYAFEARMYMLFAFLALLSFYYLYEFRPLKYLLVTILGLLTHYFMFFVLFAQMVFVLTARSYKKGDKLFQLRTIARPVALFIPWLIFMLTQHTFGDGFWISKPQLKTFFNIPAIIYMGYENSFAFYQKWLLPFSIFLLAIIAYGLWKIVKKKYNIATKEKRDLLYLLLSWSLLPAVLTYVVSFVYPIFLPRYLIFSGIGMVLLMVFLLEQIDRKMRWLLFIALFAFSLHYNALQVVHRSKAPLKSIIGQIRSEMKESDVLFVTNELDFHPAQYYLDEERVFIYGKTYEEIPQYVGKVLIPEDKIATDLPFYPRKAFILKDDNSYEIRVTY